MCIRDSSLRRENGDWYYGREPKPDRRGPFRQASEAMYSVKHYLEERDKRLRPLLSVSYTHLRAHETVLDLVCRLLLEKKKAKKKKKTNINNTITIVDISNEFDITTE